MVAEIHPDFIQERIIKNTNSDQWQTYEKGFQHGISGMEPSHGFRNFEKDGIYGPDYCRGRRVGYKEFKVLELLHGRTHYGTE